MDGLGAGDITFLVPYRSDGGERDRIWDYVRRWWTDGCPESPIVLGTSPDGPFNRAAAINNAATVADPWDVAIVLDADVVADPWAVRIAVTTAIDTGAVVLPFTEYHGLTPAWTRAVLAGNAEPERRGRLVTKREHESSIVVIPRAAWDTIGGFDPGFVGWGQEDVAFAQSARVMVGLRRVPGSVFHLYHARSRERIRSSPTYRANMERGRAYRRAHDPESIMAVRCGP